MRIDSAQILKEVRANLERLKSCPGPHVFEAVDPNRILFVKLCCRKCLGEMDHLHAVHYQEGLQHALDLFTRTVQAGDFSAPAIAVFKTMLETPQPYVQQWEARKQAKPKG